MCGNVVELMKYQASPPHLLFKIEDTEQITWKLQVHIMNTNEKNSLDNTTISSYIASPSYVESAPS